MAETVRGKVTRNKKYLVSGYAVNGSGLTHGERVTVNARDRDNAISLASAKVQCKGLSHFRALKVLCF